MIRRIASRLTLALAALLLIVLLILAWGLGTASGTRAVWNLAGDWVPGLTVASLEGRLAGPLKISELRYLDDYRELSVDSLELDWLPTRLLAGVFELDSLQVVGVRFTQLKPAPPAEDDKEFKFPKSIDLPVDLVLGDLLLRDMEFRAAPGAEPVQIARGELTASLRDQHLLVDELFVGGPLFSIQARSDVVTQDDFASETTIDWTAQPPGYAAAAGTLLIRGNLQELKLEHSVRAPYFVEQSVTLNNILDAPSFDAQSRIAKLRLSEIGDSLPDLALTGDIHGQGNADKISFDTRMQAESLSLGRISLRAAGGFKDQVLAISQFLLADEGAMRLSADGEVDLGDDAAQVALQGQWQELRWPLTGDTRIVADEGFANISGTLADYALRVHSLLQVPGQAGGTLDLEGRGDGESFELSSLQLALFDGALEGSGRVRWAPALEGNIQLAGSGIDPAVLVPELPGKLQLELQASGGSRDGVAFAQIDTATLSGTLRELPVDLHLNGQLDDGRLNLQSFRLVSGATVLTAGGQAGDSIDLDWTLSSPRLGDLLPAATGSIEGKGHVGGTTAAPALRASLRGSDLGYAQYSLKSLSLEADIDLERSTQSTLVLSLAEGAVGDITLQELELTGDGTRASHELKLVAATSLGSADLQVTGELEDTHWLAQLARGRVQYAALDPWTLTSPHAIRVSAEEQSVSNACWSSAEASLCLGGERGPGTLAAAVDLQAFALQYLQPLLPPAFVLEGLVDARVSLAQQGGEEAELDAQLTANEARLYGRSGDEQSTDPELLIALDPSRLSVLQGKTGLRADLSAPFKGAGGITAQMDIEAVDTPLRERPLRGEIDIKLSDIGLLTGFSEELGHIAGELSGQLELGGSLNDPQTQGTLELRDGAVHLVTPGLEISKINVDARTSGPRALEFSGEAESGEGTLTVSGTARLDAKVIEADITLDGDAFQLVDTPDARVFASPALAIAIRETGTRVTGELLIPRAEITPRKLPASAVSVSSDQIIVVGDTSTEPGTNAGVDARVRVSLGNDVSVDGFGFTGRLTGGLLVEQAPNRPTLGTGELNILEGEYRAYGQGLVIEEGNILFAGGPIEQPGIRVRAVRRPANDILVGVRVRGPVQEPEFDLFSEPAMSQTETLSWLVLGRPLAGSSEGQGDMLAQAATMLGLKGGNYLADKFGDNLGVDSIGFETGSGEAGAASNVNQAALVIGKYLSPDLFVSYGIGLFDSISTIKLEYILSKSWSVSTESSTDASGGDVNYVIER